MRYFSVINYDIVSSIISNFDTNCSCMHKEIIILKEMI